MPVQGFDEYMNLVLDDAEELSVKRKTRKPIGRILLKGETITLLQAAYVAGSCPTHTSLHCASPQAQGLANTEQPSNVVSIVTAQMVSTTGTCNVCTIKVHLSISQQYALQHMTTIRDRHHSCTFTACQTLRSPAR